MESIPIKRRLTPSDRHMTTTNPGSQLPRRDTSRSQPLATSTISRRFDTAPAGGVTQPVSPYEQIETGLEPAPIRSNINMSLPGGMASKYRATLVVYGNRWRAIRRWSLRSATVLVVLAIGISGFLFSQGFIKAHKVFKGGAKPVAALQHNVSPSLLKTEGDGRINVLLLGRDGGSHSNPDLTATMMVASIDPVNHTVILLSLPSNLWIDEPNQGNMKLSAAWQSGEFAEEGKSLSGSTDPAAMKAGFSEVDKTVTAILGVNIDYNAIMNFQAFEQAVDTLGGITITAPSALSDPSMAALNQGNAILAQPGMQLFNGMQTLNYLRSVQTSSDAARDQRAQAALLAIKQKATSLGTISNPVKLSGLLSAFGNNLTTDMSLSDASSLYSVIAGISSADVTTIGLSNSVNQLITPTVEENQSVMTPAAGLYNYTAIQAYVRSQLTDSFLIREHASVEVLNGTAISGLASTETQLLSSYGYTTLPAANAPSNSYASTELIDLSKGTDPYTKNYLQKRLGIKAIQTLPNKSIQTNGADFVIILGSNETTTPKG
jgi:LCP family protein required for cell wall assembly